MCAQRCGVVTVFSIFAAAGLSQATTLKSLKPILKKTIINYLSAYANGDIKAFKEVVTDTFISNMGGPLFLKEAFKDPGNDAPPKGKVVKLTLTGDPTKPLVQFTYINNQGDKIAMDKDSWFELIKKSGKWKLNRHITHLYR